MKTRIPPFLAGVVTTIFLGALSISAFAITGHMTIEVDPISIEVNGEIFQPKDANEHDVPIFAYNGTTYAPLRALAEAYGLEVGYDQEKNLAYVIDPNMAKQKDEIPTVSDTDYSDRTAEEEAAYQEFKKMWSITLTKTTIYNEKLFDVRYKGNLSIKDFEVYWLGMDNKVRRKFTEKIATDIREENPGYIIGLSFYYRSYELGYANAYEYHSLSSFAPNPFLFK